MTPDQSGGPVYTREVAGLPLKGRPPMPCHPKALARYAAHILSDRAHADEWLDRWIDVTTRATEWDADQWGFDPDRWMAVERAEMEKRDHAG